MDLRAERLTDPLPVGVADEVVGLRRAIDAGREPADPPIGAGELVADLFVDRPEQERGVWLARAGGSAAGLLVAGVNVEGGNAGYSEMELDVLPTHAGRGVEAALVGAALPWLEDRGARTLAWWPSNDHERSVAERLGLTFRQQERCSRMRVAEVDDDQQAAWIAAERARAAGYRLVTWTGRCPDHLLDAYAAAYSAMDDAPLDDIEWTPTGFTPQRVRRSEDVAERLGKRIYAAVALDRAGAGAGMTRLDVHPERPQLGWQEDTAVVPAHRGLALGRWLKAANLRRVRDAVPELEVVQTFNAESNPWMLAINVDMGFRPHRPYYAYQAPLADVSAALASV